MKKNEYIKIIQELIKKEGIDTTADIDTTAETITDTIAALYPIETETERDKLVKTIYQVLRG